MQSVLSVEPSICGVKLRKSSHVEVETQPVLPGFGALPCRPQVLERPRDDQPLLALETALEPLLPRPGGGPRPDLLIGAPHSSEVTAVGGGADSPHVFFELKKKCTLLRITSINSGANLTKKLE